MTLAPTRRRLMQLAALTAAGAASAGLGAGPAAALAPAASGGSKRSYRSPEEMLDALSDGVFLNLNENAHGPSDAALRVLARTPALSGRYGMPFSRDLAALFAEQNGLKAECVVVHPGSFMPLRNAALAHTDEGRPLIYAAPTFEAAFVDDDGAPSMPTVRVPLTDHAIDVRRLLQAAPTAGAIYVCNPNNPTGLTTSPQDIDWLMAHKPKDSVVIIDEAYIHFTDAPSSLWRVADAQDVVVLRTFSKIYGLAGMRCGIVSARPDILARMSFLGVNITPMPTILAAQASLLSPDLVPERRAYNTKIRDALFSALAAKGRTFLPSQACFAMIKTPRPARDVIASLAARRIFITGVAGAPDWVRVSYGTLEQMQTFQAALDAIMA